METLRNLWTSLSLFLLILLGSGVAFAEDNTTVTDRSGADWNGTWQSELFTMTFTQQDEVVTASYIAMNPETEITGNLNGTLSEDGKVLTGIWSETGKFESIASEDNTSFSSNLGYNGSFADFVGNGTLWSGEWKSDSYLMNLSQDGSKISGTVRYYLDDGSEIGTLTGNLSDDGKTVIGTWDEIGEMKLAISEDGGMFNGTYMFENIEPKPADTWNATRISSE